MGAGASTADGKPADLLALSETFMARGQRLCVLHGLSSAVGMELNGRLGEVQRIDRSSGRLCVRLLPDDTVEYWKKIRPENLRPSPLQVANASAQCSICLEEASEDEGVLVHACSCRGHSGATHLHCLQKAYQVQAKQPQRTLYPTCATCKSQYDGKVAVTLLLAQQGATAAAAAAAAANVRAAPSTFEMGSLVRVEGLSTAVHLNGLRGVVIAQDPRSGRWLVQLEDGTIKSIREANLQAQDEGDALPTADGSGAGGAGFASHQSTQGTIGIAYKHAGQVHMAARCLERLVEQTEASQGAEHHALCAPLSTLGVVQLDIDVAAAVRTLERALRLRERFVGPEHRDLCTTLLALGRGYRLRGDAAGGRLLVLRSLAITERHTGGAPTTPTRAAAIAAEGAAEGAAAEGKGAVLAPRDAADALSPICEELARSDVALADMEVAAQLDSAHAQLETVLALMAAGESTGAEGLPIPEIAASEAKRRGAWAAAAQLTRALELRERALGTRHEELVHLLHRLGEAWAAAAELERGVGALERALDIAGTCAGAAGGPDRITALLRDLSRLYDQLGEAEKARQARQRASPRPMPRWR